jgi:hypothetical protein
LDARSKDPIMARVGWVPARMKYSRPGNRLSPLGKRRKALMSSAFQVKGLPFEGAAQCLRVQLPEVSATLIPPGEFREPVVGSVEVGEMELSFGGAAARDAVLAWVLKQVESQPAAAEIFSFVVQVLDPSLKNVQLSFTLTDCALRGFQEDPIDSGTETLPTCQLRLAVGRVDVVFAEA